MFSLHTRPSQLCDGISRRELLRVGGLTTMGLSLPALLRAEDEVSKGIGLEGVPPSDKSFGRAKNIIYLWLAGGPPQHETFDPKPDAPIDVRGPFNPISTTVPGTHFCELLPRTAQIAHKLAVVRSMATDDNNHDSSGHWVLTGYKYSGPNSRTIQPTDWPYFGSLLKQIKPSEKLPPLTSVWIPDMMRLNENVTPAGQTGGFLGSQWDPDRFVGDPNDPAYAVEGLKLTDMTPLRLKRRESLLKQVEEHFAVLERGRDAQTYDKFQQQAFDLLTSGRAREAFAISQEPDKVRDRYGRNRWGQCVLLARRLVESGVRLVHVQWPREPGDNAVDNPLWDTHSQNSDRLEDVLCPQFDVAFSALIEDLDQRGLLAETLVVVIGEFGRTPKINATGGRDHWGPVFSFAMAGAGIAGGALYGASDKQGAYPAKDRVQPGDLTATLFHLLGVHHLGTFHDREGREHKLTLGKPIFELLGTEPATLRRAECTADLTRVPPFSDRLLVEKEFAANTPLLPADGPSRPKGWRAAPLAGTPQATGLCVEKLERRVRLGYGLAGEPAARKIEKGQTTFLAQEVRSPFAGKFRLSVTLRGEAKDRDHFQNVFLKNFACKIIYYQYSEAAKKAIDRKELAALPFSPTFAGVEGTVAETFVLEKEFVNPAPGSNFSFGLGMGIAIVIEKTSEGVLDLAAGDMAALRIDKLELEFIGKERNKDVQV